VPCACTCAFLWDRLPIPRRIFGDACQDKERGTHRCHICSQNIHEQAKLFKHVAFCEVVGGLQEEDCSPYTVVAEEAAVDGKLAHSILEDVAVAESICGTCKEVAAATAIRERLGLLKHLFQVQPGRCDAQVPAFPAANRQLRLRFIDE
jgi:hypothetical protein